MKANKNKLIPDLRFPEFKDNWANISIAEVCDVFRGGTFSKVDMVENGKFYCIHYGQLFTKYDDIIETVISKTNKSAVFKSKVGDILMPSSDVTPNGLAKASVILLDDVVLGGDMNILRPKIDINSIFLNYLINYNKTEIIKLVSGTTVKHIYPSQIVDLKLIISNSEKEQQKIASCLSSLDKIITAQTEKLELLQNHKKGLMQNLFPQDGEKVPKYRFPEFLEDGYWKEVNLGEIGDPKMCKRIFKEETTNNPVGNIPFYKIGTFGGETDSYISNDLYSDYKNRFSFPKKGEILISASGTIGRLVVYDDSPAYFQDSNIVWIANNEKQISNKFLFYCYSIATWQTSDGGIIRRLYNADLKSLKISFPKNRIEQQKIASCLSSLDNLITAQTEKIEQLKFHKKGLMQGLFPKII